MCECSECWSCEHYFIGADLDDFLAGVEECDLELPMHSNNCNKYNEQILNNYDSIEIDDDFDIPF